MQEQGPGQSTAPAPLLQLQLQSASPVGPTKAQPSIPSAIARMADAPNPFRALVTHEQPPAAKPMFSGLNAVVNPFRSPASSPPGLQPHTATAGASTSATASDAPNSSVALALDTAGPSTAAPISSSQQALASTAPGGGASASPSVVGNPFARMTSAGAGNSTAAHVGPNQQVPALAGMGSSVPGNSTPTPTPTPATTPVVGAVASPVVRQHDKVASASTAAAAHGQCNIAVSTTPAALATAQEASRISNPAQAETATASTSAALPSLASAAVPSAATATLQMVSTPASPPGVQSFKPLGASAPSASSVPSAATVPLASITASVPTSAADLPTTSATAAMPVANLPPAPRAAAVPAAAANLPTASTAAAVSAAVASRTPALIAAAMPAAAANLPRASTAAAGPATSVLPALTATAVPAAPVSLTQASTSAAVPAAAAGSRSASKRKWDVMAQLQPDAATDVAATAAAPHAVASGIADGGLPPPSVPLLPTGFSIQSRQDTLVTGTQLPISSGAAGAVQFPIPGPPQDGLAAVGSSQTGGLGPAAPLPASQPLIAVQAAQAAASKALAGKDLAAKLAADFAQQHRSKQLAVTTAAGPSGKQATPVDVSVGIKAAAAAAAEKVLQERAVRAKAAAENHIHEQALKAKQSVHSSGDVHAARMEALRLRNAARHGSPQAPAVLPAAVDQAATPAVVPEPQLTAHAAAPRHLAMSQHPEAMSDDSRSRKKRGRDEDHAASVEHDTEVDLPGPPADRVADLSSRWRECTDSPASAGSKDSLSREGRGHSSDSRQVWRHPLPVCSSHGGWETTPGITLAKSDHAVCQTSKW